jgi:hypothetical protein
MNPDIQYTPSDFSATEATFTAVTSRGSEYLAQCFGTGAGRFTMQKSGVADFMYFAQRDGIVLEEEPISPMTPRAAAERIETRAEVDPRRKTTPMKKQIDILGVDCTLTFEDGAYSVYVNRYQPKRNFDWGQDIEVLKNIREDAIFANGYRPMPGMETFETFVIRMARQRWGETCGAYVKKHGLEELAEQRRRGPSLGELFMVPPFIAAMILCIPIALWDRIMSGPNRDRNRNLLPRAIVFWIVVTPLMLWVAFNWK